MLNLEYFKRLNPQGKMILDDVGKGTFFSPPVLIEENVTIGANCQIGPNVYIERGCKISDNVHLQNVIVLRNREVTSGRIENRVIIW
jgi:UDP-3-O-[3-hydroxymyristoyl] glucosamine N-acyltransferase